MTDKLRKKFELQAQLEQTNNKTEKNKIKEEIRKINPKLIKELVGVDVKITPDILHEIQKHINAMWQDFDENNNKRIVLLKYLFQKDTPLNDIKIDNQHSLSRIFNCVEISKDGRIKQGNNLTAHKLFMMEWCNLSVTQPLINSIHKTLDPWEIERHIKFLAKILVRRKIIDANRERTFYIIFSFGFSQNYIVTSYMIPACVEYLFVKILKKMVKRWKVGTQIIKMLAMHTTLMTCLEIHKML